MLLTIHNLPAATRYADVKSLLLSKCGIQQMILDNLVVEGDSKKVTVGVAEDADAAILVRKINGLFWNGQQLYVEDVRQQKSASDQPYRSSEPQPQQDLPFSSMNLAWNSSFNLVPQQATPMYYNPIAAEAYGASAMVSAQDFGQQEKVQSAYPGISGFSQNAMAAPQYGASQFDNQQDYNQPPKRSRWENDNQGSMTDKALYGRRYDQNRDWQNNRRDSPPRDNPRGYQKPVWDSASNDNHRVVNQPDFRANVRPTQPDFRSNSGSNQPDFRANVRPTEPDFRSTIRPKDRSEFVRPGLLDNARREFESNNQRRQPELQGSSTERDKFSRRPNNEFYKRSNDEFSRRPNDEFSGVQNDQFSRRPNDQFSRRPNDEFSRKSNERAQFSRRPNDCEEPPRRPNDCEELSRGPTERAEFSRRPNVPSRSHERQGTNQFSGRQEFSERPERTSRFDQPNFSRNSSGFNRNVDVARRGPARNDSFHEPRSKPDSRKRKFEESKPDSGRQRPVSPPKQFREHHASKPTAAPLSTPPMTEEAKGKLRRQMRYLGSNQILSHIYKTLALKSPDRITRQMFREFVKERMDAMFGGDKRMLTANECFELYRAKYPASGDRAAYEVILPRIAQHVGKKKTGVKETSQGKPVLPALAPPNTAQPEAGAARDPPPKQTRGERKAKKNLKEARQLMSQGKVPKFPLGDKSKVAQNKKEEELGILPDMAPVTRAALEEEIGAVLDLCVDELNNPPDETTRQIYKSVDPEELIGELRKILGQSVARRVTDSGLKVVRIYGVPKLPTREVLEKYLIKFGVQALKKSQKSKMYTASVSTYKNYDRLCNTSYNGPDGVTVHFKPFHVAPKVRADQALLKSLRKEIIKGMIDRSDLNLLDKDWPAKEKEIKEREAAKQAALEATLEAEKAAFEEQAAIDANSGDKLEEWNDNDNLEIAEQDVDEDFEANQTNSTLNESNDYLRDDFHVIDEVNENDSEVECFGNTAQVLENGENWCEDDDVNTGNTAQVVENEENGIEGDLENTAQVLENKEIWVEDDDVNTGKTARVLVNEEDWVEDDVDNTTVNNDNGGDNNDQNYEAENADGDGVTENVLNIDKNDKHIEEDKIKDDGNVKDDYENYLNNDSDFEMGDANIDNVDIDDLDDGDLEDY